MKRSTFFWLLILAALLLALLVEAHTGHLGHFSLFMAGIAASTPAMPTTNRIERVLTIYSDNDAGRVGLLMTRAQAEQYARGVVGQYLTLATHNNGRGGLLFRDMPDSRAQIGRILDYRLDDFPAHPGVGRVLVICERC